MAVLYPADELPGYSRDESIRDLLPELETEIRNCVYFTIVDHEWSSVKVRLEEKMVPH